MVDYTDKTVDEFSRQIKLVMGNTKKDGSGTWNFIRSGDDALTKYQATAGTSTTKQTMLTPTSGKAIRIRNVMAVTASTTGAIFEVYFGAGANITSDAANAIFIAHLDQDLAGTVTHSEFYGDNGPVGIADEVVSIRTSADITTNGLFVIVYTEE